MQLIAQGLDITELEQSESLLAEGEAGEVRLYLSQEPTIEQLQALQDGLLERGVILTEPIAYDARIVSIKFVKGIAPLVIVGLVVGGLFATGIGWQVFKATRAGIPLWVIGLGGAALLYLLLRSKPAKQAGGLAIQAGKVYVSRKALK